MRRVEDESSECHSGLRNSPRFVFACFFLTRPRVSSPFVEITSLSLSLSQLRPDSFLLALWG